MAYDPIFVSTGIVSIVIILLWLYYVIFNIRLHKNSHEFRVTKITRHGQCIKIGFWLITVAVIFSLFSTINTMIAYAGLNSYYYDYTLIIVLSWVSFGVEIFTFYPQ